MLRYIYALPLRQIIALMLITIPMWAFGQLRQGRALRTWRIVNGCLFALVVVFILTTTVVPPRQPSRRSSRTACT